MFISRFTFHNRQREGKHSSAPAIIACPDPPVMVLDNLFADRKSEASTVFFAERGKNLKQLVGDFRRDAAAGVDDFCDEFIAGIFESNEDGPAGGHSVRGIMNQVYKHAAQALWIER